VRHTWLRRTIFVALVLCGASSAAQFPIAATSSADNRFEVFVKTGHGIEHFWEDGHGAWLRNPSPYQPKPPINEALYRLNTIAAARDSRGRLMVAWIVRGEVFYASAPRAGSPLNAPGALIYDTADVRTISLAMNSDGRLELFTLDMLGFLKSYKQEVAGVWSWSPASPRLSPVRMKAISTTRLGSGQVVVVGLTSGSSGVDGHLVALRQTVASADSYEEIFSAGDGLQHVVARASIDGRLEVFAVGGNGDLYHKYEYATGEYTDFLVLVKRPFSSSPQFTTFDTNHMVVSSADGTLEVLAHRRHDTQPVMNSVYHLWQMTPNGGWAGAMSPVQSLSAIRGPGSFASAESSNGRLGVFEFAVLPRPSKLFFSTQSGFNSNSAFPREPLWSAAQVVHTFPD
jgi:hypothetical protein